MELANVSGIWVNAKDRLPPFLGRYLCVFITDKRWAIEGKTGPLIQYMEYGLSDPEASPMYKKNILHSSCCFHGSGFNFSRMMKEIWWLDLTLPEIEFSHGRYPVS